MMETEVLQLNIEACKVIVITGDETCWKGWVRMLQAALYMTNTPEVEQNGKKNDEEKRKQDKESMWRGQQKIAGGN